MSIEVILLLLGVAAAGVICEEVLDAVWNAISARRRRAEEDARLERIAAIVASARLNGTPAALDDNRGMGEIDEPLRDRPL